MSKTLIFAKKIWKNRPYRHSHAVTSFLVKCCVVQVGVEQGLFIGNLFYCPLYWTFIITLRYPQLLVFSLALKLNSLIHHMRHSESICWFGFGRFFHFGYGSNLTSFLLSLFSTLYKWIFRVLGSSGAWQRYWRWEFWVLLQAFLDLEWELQLG